MAALQTLPEATTFLQPATSGNRTTLAARSFLYAVFKHRRLVVGIFLLVFLASAVAALMRPSTYRATTKVLVKLGETVQVAPAEAPSKSVYLPLSQEVVKTEADIVQSREVVEEAIKRLGVQPEPEVSWDELVANMQLALTVQPQPGSNVLQISYLGRSPERAARMVNAITDVYLEHHARVYGNQGVSSFYTTQLRQKEIEVEKAQKKLRNFLRAKEVVDVEKEIEILAHDHVEQQKNLRGHRGKVRGQERKLAAVLQQMEKTPESLAYAEEYNLNPSLQALKQKLTELEIERTTLLQAYLPTDRHIRDKDEQIGKLRAQMRSEQERILGTQTVRRNDVYSDLERIRNTLEFQLADLREREPGLAGRARATKRRLNQLRDFSFTITNMKQHIADKTYALELFRKKQEEARITETMANQAMVNVSVVARATAPLEPVNGLAVPLMLGLLGGIGLGAAMAIGIEFLNRRLRFEEEVERYLDLPVLAVIPELETTSAVARA
jgi:uncharacterized protein involved in exopolysaccharide biosynthesis